VSILMPIADKGVTLTEVPDHIAVFFTFGNCQSRCKGCHSPELWEDCKRISLRDMGQYAQEQIDKGANAILLMGGTTNGLTVEELIAVINSLSLIAPVCLYSGSDDDALHERLVYESRLSWLKTGSYQQEKGGLMCPTSNQRFYRIDYLFCTKRYELIDILPVRVDITNDFRRDSHD